ncbi:MAG: hypothetical protein K2X01_02260 [Cyanobacteria bacterium]|nr:hypothetical protein [Cyanobacteriota bacterium]
MKVTLTNSLFTSSSSAHGSTASEYVVPGVFVTLAFVISVTLISQIMPNWFASSQSGTITNGIVAVQPFGSNVTFPGSSSGSSSPIGPPPAGWTQTCFTGNLCVNIPPTPPTTIAGLGNQQISIFASMLQSLSSQLGSQLGTNDPLVQALNHAASNGNSLGDNWGVMSGYFNPYHGNYLTTSSSFNDASVDRTLNSIHTLETNLGTNQSTINTLLASSTYQSLLANNPGLSNLINFLITGMTTLSGGFTDMRRVMGTGESASYNQANLNAYTSYLNAAGLQGIANGTASPPQPHP